MASSIGSYACQGSGLRLKTYSPPSFYTVYGNNDTSTIWSSRHLSIGTVRPSLDYRKAVSVTAQPEDRRRIRIRGPLLASRWLNVRGQESETRRLSVSAEDRGSATP
jgi:hypothetical protein